MSTSGSRTTLDDVSLLGSRTDEAPMAELCAADDPWVAQLLAKAREWQLVVVAAFRG